jgi:hypothetical protein
LEFRMNMKQVTEAPMEKRMMITKPPNNFHGDSDD